MDTLRHVVHYRWPGRTPAAVWYEGYVPDGVSTSPAREVALRVAQGFRDCGAFARVETEIEIWLRRTPEDRVFVAHAHDPEEGGYVGAGQTPWDAIFDLLGGKYGLALDTATPWT